MRDHVIEIGLCILAVAIACSAVVSVIVVPQVTVGKAGCQHAGIRFNTESKYIGPPYYKHCYLTNGERWMSTGEYARLYGKVGGDR